MEKCTDWVASTACFPSRSSARGSVSYVREEPQAATSEAATAAMASHTPCGALMA